MRICPHSACLIAAISPWLSLSPRPLTPNLPQGCSLPTHIFQFRCTQPQPQPMSDPHQAGRPSHMIHPGQGFQITHESPTKPHASHRLSPPLLLPILKGAPCFRCAQATQAIVSAVPRPHRPLYPQCPGRTGRCTCSAQAAQAVVPAVPRPQCQGCSAQATQAIVKATALCSCQS